MPVPSFTQGLVRIATFFGGAACLAGLIRFPGLVCQHGGGAFFIAYAVCLAVLVRPVLRAVEQWSGTMCNPGGGDAVGFACSRPLWDKIFVWAGGVLATLVGVAMTLIAAWCLGLAWKLFAGATVADHDTTFTDLAGQAKNGALWSAGTAGVLPWLAIAVALVFLLSRWWAKRWGRLLRPAIPLALLVAILLLLPRLLSLGVPDLATPSHSVASGLDLIWQPSRLVLEERPAGQAHFYRRVTLIPGSPAHLRAVAASVAAADTFQATRIGLIHALRDPRLWLAAVGQVGLALVIAVGFALSSATTWPGGKGWPEGPSLWLGLLAGGLLGCLLSLPAVAAFLGGATTDAGPFAPPFAALPSAFSRLPGGGGWGGLFFLLLGLSALTVASGLLRISARLLKTARELPWTKATGLLLALLLACLGVLTWATRSHSALAQMDFWTGNLAAVCVTGLLLRSALSGPVPSGHPTPFLAASRLKRLLARFRLLLGWGFRWTPPVLLLGIVGLWTTHQILALTVSDRQYHLEPQLASLLAPGTAQDAWLGLLPVFLTVLLFALVLKTGRRYCLGPVKN